MTGVQKRTPKKEKKTRVSKVGKSKTGKKEKKHRHSKHGKQRNGKVRVSQSPKKSKGGKKISRSKAKKDKMSKVPKRSPTGKPNRTPASPSASAGLKKQKKEKKVKKEKEGEKKDKKDKEHKKENVVTSEEALPKTTTLPEVKTPEKEEMKKIRASDEKVEKKQEPEVKKKSTEETAPPVSTDKKVNDLQRVDKVPDTKTAGELVQTPPVMKKKSKSGRKMKEDEPKEERDGTPEARTPDQVGPPLVVEQKEEKPKKRKEEKNERRETKEKKGDKKTMKEKEKDVGTPELKTPDQEGPPLMEEANGKEEEKKEEKAENNEKKEKVEEKAPSLENTQSDPSRKKSPPKTSLGAPLAPPGSKRGKIRTADKKPSPPVSDNSGKQPKNMRSELETPCLEDGFVAHNGDTRQKIEMKKVDIDLIGRTGMYIERGGMTSEKKKAFDWIAFNRHDLTNKQKDFSHNLAVALADVGIGKNLVMRTVVFLKSHGQISASEMDKVLSEVKNAEPTISFSQLSVFLRKHCDTYKAQLIQPPTTDAVPNGPVAPKKKDSKMAIAQ